MFLAVFPSGPLSTNTILLGCSETNVAAVIDPALGSTPSVLNSSRVHDLRIEKILLTHSHWDHIADLVILVQKTKAPVYVHVLDAANVEHPGSDGIPLPIELEGMKPDHQLRDGEELSVGRLRGQVIHSPGHSPGSICYFFPEQKILFSGDTLFAGTMGAIHFSTGDPEKMWKSLRKLSTLPTDTRVIPGHGPETVLAKEIWMRRAKEFFS
jgi:hydroxyacylglutathione hydrolase